jgi:hypothetical protein
MVVPGKGFGGKGSKMKDWKYVTKKGNFSKKLILDVLESKVAWLVDTYGINTENGTDQLKNADLDTKTAYGEFIALKDLMEEITNGSYLCPEVA